MHTVLFHKRSFSFGLISEHHFLLCYACALLGAVQSSEVKFIVPRPRTCASTTGDTDPNANYTVARAALRQFGVTYGFSSPT
jgi:hypothetical protein